MCVCVWGGDPSWSTPYNFLQRNSPTLQPQIGIMTWHFQDQTRGAHFSSVDFSVIVRSRRGVAFVWNTFFHIYLNVWLWQKEIKSTPTALLAESVWVRWGVTGHWPHSTGQKLRASGLQRTIILNNLNKSNSAPNHQRHTCRGSEPETSQFFQFHQYRKSHYWWSLCLLCRSASMTELGLLRVALGSHYSEWFTSREHSLKAKCQSRN